MNIKSLKLTNFRNWADFKLDFNNVTILIGPNGIGKTNIMEAIWMLSTSRSWRTLHDIEAINWEADFARLEAKIHPASPAGGDDKTINLNLVLQKHPTKTRPQPKILKINEVRKRLIDLLGRLPAVLFSPETIQIIDGAPSLRRRFLDILLSQIDKKYALALLDYSKIIKERNQLLWHIKIGKSREDPSRRRQAEADELEFWDEKLVVLGRFIIKKRQEAIRFFNELLPGYYQDISGGKESLNLRYRASCEAERLGEMLVANRARDIESTSTNFGPHRDDLMILLNNKDITTFGSRGEYRSAVLALKMGELKYLEEKRGEKPILLLDDIFSELDKDRRLHLAKIVSHQQTIITTTDLDHIEKGLREKAKIVELA